METPLNLDLSPMSGEELLAARRALGLRQEDLAQIAGFGWQGTISRMERGRAAVPTGLAVLVRLLVERASR